MTKSKKDSHSDPDYPPLTLPHLSDLPYNRPKIKPFILTRVVSPHQRHQITQKRIKNYKVLIEDETNTGQLPCMRRKNFYLRGNLCQKQTRTLNIPSLPIGFLLQVLSHAISRYSYLRGINMQFKETVKDEALSVIARYISRLSRLKTLTLGFYQKQLKVRDQGFRGLEKSLCKLKRLRNIGLSFKENKMTLFQAGLVPVGLIFDQKNKTMRIFPSLFSQLTNLQSIKLTITEQNTLTEDELIRFGQRLARLQSIKALYVNFLDCRSILFKGINAFLDNISSLPHLHSLGLAFTIFENIGKGTETPSLHPIWQLESLHHVSLEMKFIAVFPSDVMDTLIMSVAQIKQIEKIGLSFHRCQLTKDEDIKALISTFKYLPNLNYLDLSFVFCQSLHASTANEIMYYIGTMTNLETASLMFQSCFKRAIESPSEMKEPLGPGSRISKFTLSFIDCQGLSDYHITEMANLIKICKKVREISVSLNWCKAIRNEHIKELLKEICSLEYVEQLTLGFQGCSSEERDRFIELKKLKSRNLKHLDINTSSWVGITDKNLKEFGKALSALKELEDLSLNFHNCKEVSDSGVQLMCDYFTRLQELRNLSLNWNSGNMKDIAKIILPGLEQKLKKLCSIQLHSPSTKMWVWLNE